MEEFFYNQSPEPLFWFEPDPNPQPCTKSAFRNYEKNADFIDKKMIDLKGKYTNKNVNKRMIEFLRRNRDEGLENKGVERERCYKHMMNERVRRENQRLSYSALRAHLPHGTKNDKKTIVQVATSEITELQNYKLELNRRKKEIETFMEATKEQRSKTESAKISFRVSNPTSGINSMLQVLKCLKNVGSTTRSIQSNFSDHELTAVLQIGHEVEAAEVEKLVETTLFQVERKHPFYTPIY